MAETWKNRIQYVWETKGEKASLSAVKKHNAAYKKTAENTRELGQAYKKTAADQKLLNKQSDITYRNNRNLLGSFSVLRSKLLLSVFAIGALTKTVGKYISVSSSFEETMNKFNVVFGESTDSALQFANTLGNEVGRSVIDITEMMAGLQDTFVPLGFARDQSAELSKSLTKLAMDVASFQNRADTEVVNAFTSAIVGNHEAVRRYGIVLTEAQLQSTALKEGIIKVERELTAQEKVLARMLVIYSSTLDAEGDLIDTQGSYTNQLKDFNAELKDLQKAVGDSLIPLAENLLELGTYFADIDRLKAYAFTVGMVTTALVGLDIITKAATVSTLTLKSAVYALGGKAAMALLAGLAIATAEVLTKVLQASSRASEGTDNYTDSLYQNSLSLRENIRAISDSITALEDMTRAGIGAALVADKIALMETEENLKSIINLIKTGQATHGEGAKEQMDAEKTRKAALEASIATYEEFFTTTGKTEAELSDRTKELATSTYEWKIVLLGRERDKHKAAKLDESIVNKWYAAEVAKLEVEAAKKADKLREQQAEKIAKLREQQAEKLISINLKISELTDSQLNYELKALEVKYQKEISLAQYNAELSLAIHIWYLEQKKKLEEDDDERKKQAQIDGINQLISSFSGVGSAYSQMVQGQLNEDINKLKSSAAYEKATMEQREIMEQKIKSKHHKAAKRAANLEKAAKVASSIMNTYEAYTRALALTMNPLIAQGVAALGAAQTALILATPTGYAKGGEFVTNKPELIMVGEAGREHVKITPTDRPESRALKDNKVFNINISGGIVQEDYVVNELLPAINKAKALA
jgi:hypothetical protein